MNYTLFVHCDLYHTTLLIAALAASRSAGHKASIATRRSISPSVVRLMVDGKMIAFDLRDQSYSICLDTLEAAEVYFKRSYYQPHLLPFPESLQRKIRPSGLNFAFRTKPSDSLVTSLFLHQSMSVFRLRDTLRTYVGLAPLENFEQSPAAPDQTDPVIHFQTRVWEPGDMIGDDPREVNDVRVAIVRQLRKTFGNRFKGGLVPSEFARANYPDAISTEPYIRSQHALTSRRAMIGIYTRGLHHSHAFKLPEYLASSKCIVGEPLRNELPEPLQEGCNYLGFTSVEGCVSQCDRLLSNPRQCQEMRAANWEYYSRYVRFDQRLANWLRASS